MKSKQDCPEMGEIKEYSDGDIKMNLISCCLKSS